MIDLIILLYFELCSFFQQNETPQDIARRKNFSQILDILLDPPAVITPEERLKREKEQAKGEKKSSKDKGDKKRTNDSGTSSKDSSTRTKEKKKVRLV